MKTKLQKQFEEQTPTIKGVSNVEYLQTFISWLHLQVEKLQSKVITVYCTCKEELEVLDTTEGDPQGIRKDMKCTKCGQKWGSTKSHRYKI